MISKRWIRAIAVSTSMVIFSVFGFTQSEANSKLKAASFDGTTGLFKTWDAETLRKGETNFTFGYDQFNRDPGQLTIGRAVVGGAVGIVDRFEVFGSVDVVRHITAGNMLYNWSSPDSPLFNSLNGIGQPYSSQAAPFVQVPSATGFSDVHLGFKLNMLSERMGSPLSMAFTGFGTIPGQRNKEGLRKGLSSGAYQGGFAFLFSKTASKLVRFHLNVGTNMYDDSNLSNADFQNEFIYRFGAEFPVHKSYRLIAELNGTGYYGRNTTPGWNPSRPVDVIVGMRFFPREWMSLSAGYQASIIHVSKQWETMRVNDASSHGFVVQGAFGTRRNDPPTASCAVNKNSILQDDTATIRVSASDPDGDALAYTWVTTGGKISGNGDTATFDATKLAPGKYSVTATVKDKKHSASCSSDITVLKRNLAPTATVEPSSFSMLPGESTNLRCLASDPNNDPLTYAWTANGQKLAAEGPQITFGSEGRNPGSYNITCTVNDGELSASASSNGTVREKPNQVPSLECLTTTLDVASGGSVELQAKASDPDGDKLSYSWTASGGTVNGNGNTATFNATGVKAGSYIVTTAVDDGRGGKASCSMTVNVSERLIMARDKCGYFAPGKSRVDNCAKAMLDDLAMRMKNDPKLHANVIGYTDGSKLEKRQKNLGEARAKAIAEYLQKQGVEASRLTITDGGANNPAGDNAIADGRTLNRRVEIELAVK